MTAVCMVVHAEGPGELGTTTWDLSPTDSLQPDDLGPAHIIVQRILTEGAQIPALAIDFVEPLRTKTGARAHGSQLLKPSALDEILAGWLLALPLIVLLVDSDDKPPVERESILKAALERNALAGAVGVAVKEFESWLIADAKAINQIIGNVRHDFQTPEKLACGEAKQTLQKWIQDIAHPSRQLMDIRRELATAMDLDVVTNLCPSFKSFRQALLGLDAQNFKAK
ncbi:DUF4276 family protein [Leptothoe spongobia]|uniref:DUF4276 family protein n=1 Tax=Leptothoe spongobia TAU-MAC 1115 TaxID=1967444 RepID=A0A947DEL4_9CYAN|nr:DUF4276 family protein [Leptothoe spongobia]MBT9315697.1 DUF4276 family protein [Leptothoe spongobia TAU-MAC 1115]